MWIPLAFFPLSLTKESKARCLLPACTQALKGQLGWGRGRDVQAVAPQVLPWASVGCYLVPSHPSGIRHLQTLIACHCCQNHHFMGRWELTVFWREHTLLFRVSVLWDAEGFMAWLGAACVCWYLECNTWHLLPKRGGSLLYAWVQVTDMLCCKFIKQVVFLGTLRLWKNTEVLWITGTLLSKKPQSLCALLLNTREIIMSSLVIRERRFGLF